MNRKPFHKFAITLAVCSAFFLTAGDLFAQPGRGGGGPGFGGGGAAGLLRSEAVQTELDLSEDQLNDLKELGEKMREEMRGMFEGMRDLSREEREEKMRGMREKMQEKMKEIEKSAGEILLDDQRKRLEQIHAQMAMQGRGRSGTGLLSPVIIEKLEITEEQQDEIREKAEAMEQEVREKIEKIRKESRDKLLKSLSKEQRKKYDELVGNPFDFESMRSQWGRGGGDRRGGEGERRGGEGERRGGDRPDSDL